MLEIPRDKSPLHEYGCYFFFDATTHTTSISDGQYRRRGAARSHLSATLYHGSESCTYGSSFSAKLVSCTNLGAFISGSAILATSASHHECGVRTDCFLSGSMSAQLPLPWSIIRSIMCHVGEPEAKLPQAQRCAVGRGVCVIANIRKDSCVIAKTPV